MRVRVCSVRADPIPAERKANQRPVGQQATPANGATADRQRPSSTTGRVSIDHRVWYGLFLCMPCQPADRQRPFSIPGIVSIEQPVWYGLFLVYVMSTGGQATPLFHARNSFHRRAGLVWAFLVYAMSTCGDGEVSPIASTYKDTTLSKQFIYFSTLTLGRLD